MPNNVNLPKGFQTLLDEVYRKAACTAVLDSSPTDLKPTQNVNEFCYPQLEVGGLGDYDRARGYTSKFDYQSECHCSKTVLSASFIAFAKIGLLSRTVPSLSMFVTNDVLTFAPFS